MDLSHSELILRIAIGAALGGVIGFERDFHGRHAGLRTHLIVAMASATFMVISGHFVYYQGYDGNHHIEVDASRIAASVVSGIGFLAGGAILKTGATIQGLTTAAGLWLVTAIGLCSGSGMYPEAVAVTIMGLTALTLLRKFEDKNDRMAKRHVCLELNDGQDAIKQILDALTSVGVSTSHFNYEKQKDEKKICVEFEIRYPINIEIQTIIDKIEAQVIVKRLQISNSA